MKWFTLAGLFAFAVLSCAAVWMGGLNQDEGWYLYAANLVAEGKMPYRDFFYTQGPLMPMVYSAFCRIWNDFGILGGRIFTWLLGTLGILFMVATARNLAPQEHRREASVIVFLLLGSNLYHLYFLSIPKTYALCSLLTAVGCWLLTLDGRSLKWKIFYAFFSGLALAFAAGARISFLAMLPAIGLPLLWRRDWRAFLSLGFGAAVALAITYGPFLVDESSRAGLAAAQHYHASRGGKSLTMTIGSLSRFVRWYSPLCAVFILGLLFRRLDGKAVALTSGFAAVFVLQMLAPFPYEDYQVPVMGILAALAAALFAGCGGMDKKLRLVLVSGLSFAVSFGSPLLEKWTVNGQDRFWPLMKEKCELSQLQDVARRINALDPGGKSLFTQDTYLAIETGRKVPIELAMGPFSVMTDSQWRELIRSAAEDYPVAAFSGYTFAIEPPRCSQRPIEQQMEYWKMVKDNYKLADREENFGQNSTTLLILEKK